MIMCKTFRSFGELPVRVGGHAKKCVLVTFYRCVNIAVLPGSFRYRAEVSVLHTAVLFCCILWKPFTQHTTAKV